MTTLYGIKESNFFDFIKKINEFNRTHNVVATQTHLDSQDNVWYAIIYFGEEREAKSKTTQGIGTKKSYSPVSNKATEKQISFLKKQGVRINENLTKEEAKIMISNYIKNLKKENI
jgi:hypothetical protein